MKITVYAMAILATAACARSLPKRGANGQTVVYWGQNDNERSLAEYCASGEGIDIIVLAFLSTLGNNNRVSGSFGNECSLDSEGNGSCGSLKSNINTCHGNGKKVFISVRGYGANYDLTSDADADGLLSLYGINGQTPP